MKVQVSEIKPNPFRNMERYPIDRETVESLKGSIQETDFWDNLLARPNHEGYQLAYGHHRLAALQELDYKEIDIPVRDLDDPTMLKIMVLENMQDWDHKPIVMVEGVREAKKLLDAELAKYDTWEKYQKSNLSILPDCPRQEDFSRLKSKKTGRDIIFKFLPSPPIKEWMVREALRTINDENLTDEIIEEFETTSDLNSFRKAVDKINKTRDEELSNEELKDLAKKAGKRKKVIKEKRRKKKTEPNESKGEMETIILQEIGGDNAVQDAKTKDLAVEINSINTDANKLRNNILSLNTQLNEMGVQQINNFPLSLDSVHTFSTMFSSVATMMEYFGIEFKEEIKKLQS